MKRLDRTGLWFGKTGGSTGGSTGDGRERRNRRKTRLAYLKIDLAKSVDARPGQIFHGEIQRNRLGRSNAGARKGKPQCLGACRGSRPIEAWSRLLSVGSNRIVMQLPVESRFWGSGQGNGRVGGRRVLLSARETSRRVGR